MIAALFVEKNGVYSNLDDVDPWDETRDARRYDGPWPVVAHPPCARWCQLAGLVESRYPHFRKGADGGSFASALASVRIWGGVLEHPAYSKAWPAHGLSRPARAGWQRSIDGSWTCEVSQAPYGHRARKLTWLYYVGDAAPPELDWSQPLTGVSMSWCANHGGACQRMGKRERNATPPAFRDLLIAMARSARTMREPCC